MIFPPPSFHLDLILDSATDSSDQHVDSIDR